MSAPVRIPARRGAPGSVHRPQRSPSGSRDLALDSPSAYQYSSSSAASSYISPYSSVGSGGATSLPRVSSPLRAVELPPAVDDRTGKSRASGQMRRASLMSSSLAACEHTVINVGDPDRPRLITCVKHSQGFDWNQEIFLPSHYDHLISPDLERKRDPVHDIYLSEEDMQGILPQ